MRRLRRTRRTGPYPGVVACGVDSTVGDVVELMVTRRVHHVYVCSSDRHPLAVVTPHDILRLVADRLVEG